MMSSLKRAAGMDRCFHLPAKVDHLEIEKCDAVLADKILDLLYILKHEGSSCSHNFRGDSPNSERLRLVKMTEILDLCSSAL